VKGPSVLATVTGYDYIEGTTVDYMHQQSGHGKDMIKLWTDSKNNKQPWLFFLSFFPLSFSFFNFYSAWVLVFLFFFF